MVVPGLAEGYTDMDLETSIQLAALKKGLGPQSLSFHIKKKKYWLIE